MKIYRIAQEYMTFVEVSVFDQIDAAWNVFKDNKIKPNRNKDITDIALSDGTVIGAVASGWDIGDNKATFSFDIAINNNHQGMKIGTNLVKQALERYNNDKSSYREMGYNTEIELEVINLRFGEYLVRQFGFEVVRKLADRLILRKE
jgi:ribosomal protein S18 acetylase RimI-like enzyme